MPPAAGPSTPAPAAPSSPGSKGPRSPVRPGSPQAPAAPPKAPKLPTLPSSAQVGYGEPTGWRIWWDHNRDLYLELRPKVRVRQRASDDGNFYLGQGSGGEALDLSVRPDQLIEEVLPALVLAVRDNGSAEMRRRALLAFAKLPAEQCTEQKINRFKIFKTYLGDPNYEVSKTAAVCLGMLGGPEAIDTLEHLLMACDIGSKLVNRTHVTLGLRVNAAYALGLAGSRTTNLDERRFVLHFLGQAIENDRSASPDLISACVSAIGVVPMPVSGALLADVKAEPLGSNRESQVAVLMSIYEDDKERRVARAHAVTAIGRLMSGADRAEFADRELVARKLIRGLTSSGGQPREVRQSLVGALAAMADSDADQVDVTIRKALKKAAGDTDQLTSTFALVGLAQAAGRSGDAEKDVYAGVPDARKHLLQVLARAKGETRPWAALSLGLLGHGVKQGGYYPSEDVSDALAQVLRSTKNPETVGAIALAFGLRGDGQFRAVLEERLEDNKSDDLTGSEIAVALGLIGAAGSEEALRELFNGASRRPALLREAAIARTLLGDDRISADLIEQLAQADTLGAQAGLAGALAFVGESRTVTPIAEALASDKCTQLGRSYLVAALGEICEGTALPWTATYSVGLNYGAAPESLERGKSSGLLNLD